MLAIMRITTFSRFFLSRVLNPVLLGHFFLYFLTESYLCERENRVSQKEDQNLQKIEFSNGFEGSTSLRLETQWRRNHWGTRGHSRPNSDEIFILSEFKQQFDSQLNSQPHKETKAFHIILGKFSNGRDFHRFSSFQWKIQRNLCISYRNKWTYTQL